MPLVLRSDQTRYSPCNCSANRQNKYSSGVEFVTPRDTFGHIQKDLQFMAQQMQKTCPTCGPVLATANVPMSFVELIGGGLLSAVTCGIGALVFIPYCFWRGMKAATYRCPNCGAKC